MRVGAPWRGVQGRSRGALAAACFQPRDWGVGGLYSTGGVGAGRYFEFHALGCAFVDACLKTVCRGASSVGVPFGGGGGLA